MDYFILEQSVPVILKGREEVKTEESVICKVSDITSVQRVDYLSEGNLISDRLKQLFEAFLPKRVWKPYVFLDMEKQNQEVFWYLDPEEYQPYSIEYNKMGKICELQIDPVKIPRVFKIVPEKGRKVVLIHLSATECLLRRGIMGLELIPVKTFL